MKESHLRQFCNLFIKTRGLSYLFCRFDRSMSLPLNGILDDGDMRRNSPVRRMDFALCKYIHNTRLSLSIIAVSHNTFIKRLIKS